MMPSTSDQSKFDVLLVEDHLGDIELTRQAFEELDIACNLCVVQDGEQALAYLRNEGPYQGARRPDLILLDLNLPRMDGREFLKQVKTRQEYRTIPIVVLTTSQNEFDVVNSYDLLANAYMIKPVDFDGFFGGRAMHKGLLVWCCNTTASAIEKPMGDVASLEMR